MWQLTQTVQDFLVSCHQGIVKEGQSYAGVCFKFHPSLGNIGELVIAIVCRLRHKSIVADMAHLDIDLLQFRKGLFEILKSMKITLVITAKLLMSSRAFSIARKKSSRSWYRAVKSQSSFLEILNGVFVPFSSSYFSNSTKTLRADRA